MEEHCDELDWRSYCDIRAAADMARQTTLALLLLTAMVLLRGLLLEYSDLVDPTETRYASVAQEMVLLGDWITPRLPMPEGVVPYMGKPPLHFWLTATAYTLFGVDEWTARLPSWLATIGILWATISFGRTFFGDRIAISAALIAFSSGMLFFLAGASVTDVTLTAFVTASTYLLYLLAISNTSKPSLGLLSTAFMALGFLTKGPVAVVLTWLPLLLWCAVQRDFSCARKVPWTRCVILFLSITAPWFIANELCHPGSFKYFFWNENIARYLLEEYGDKYGSGHVHTYGVSWLMLFAAFAPWSFVLAGSIYYTGWRTIVSRVAHDRDLLFTLVWGISAALFFTFVRQLHAMYVLPCIPGMALFTAVLLDRRDESGAADSLEILAKGTLRWLSPLIMVVFILSGVWLEVPLAAIGLAIVLACGGTLLVNKLLVLNTRFAAIQSVASSVMLSYLVGIVCITSYVDERRSAAELLDDIADATIEQPHVPNVGIVTKNSYSLYWTSKAWANELSRELRVQYAEPGHITDGISYLILRSKDVFKLSDHELEVFGYVKQRGKWVLLSRNTNSVRQVPNPGWWDSPFARNGNCNIG